MKASDKNSEVTQLPPLLFRTGKGFYEVGINCAKSIKIGNDLEILTYLPSATVNLIFAIELFIKGIIIVLIKKSLKGHSLIKLFSELPENIKRDIESDYDKHLERDRNSSEIGSYKMQAYKKEEENSRKSIDEKEMTLAELLKSHNKAFENWRYNHEVSIEGYLYDSDLKALNCLAKALMDCIKKIY